MVEEGTANKAFKDALAGTFDLRTSAPGLAEDLRRAAAVLLTRAQRAGAVRDDIDVADLMALVVGVFAAQDQRDDPTRRDHLLTVIVDGLLT